MQTGVIILWTVAFCYCVSIAGSARTFKTIEQVLDDDLEESSFAQTRDGKGCDAFIAHCGKNGACCDVHDACYKKHSCNQLSWALLALPRGYLYPCYWCNINVMACFVALNPGASSCCKDNSCGQEQARRILYG